MDYKLGVHISVNTMRAYYFIIRYDEDGTTWLTWLGDTPPGHPHEKEIEHDSLQIHHSVRRTKATENVHE